MTNNPIDQRVVYLPHVSFLETCRSLSTYDLSQQLDTILDTIDMLRGNNIYPDCVRSAYAWEGHETLLSLFGGAVALELRAKRRVKQATDNRWGRLDSSIRPAPNGRPAWLGTNMEVHRSHRSVLIHLQGKRIHDTERPYGLLWPNTPERMPILWPQAEESERVELDQKDIERIGRAHRLLQDNWKLTKKGKVKIG